MQKALDRTYLPAAGHDWALPLYDPFVKLLGGDKAREMLLDQAGLQPGHRILDAGCGTGSFAVLIKRLYADVSVTGLDPDPKALGRAAAKARGAALSISFDRGFSDELPYGDACFDRVFSSFMFHHVQADRRGKTLREIRRVLAPGGSLHLLDFEPPEASEGNFLTRWIHSAHHLKDNSERRILALMEQAGFVQPEKIRSGSVFFGLMRTAYYRANVGS